MKRDTIAMMELSGNTYSYCSFYRVTHIESYRSAELCTCGVDVIKSRLTSTMTSIITVLNYDYFLDLDCLNNRHNIQEMNLSNENEIRNNNVQSVSFFLVLCTSMSIK